MHALGYIFYSSLIYSIRFKVHWLRHVFLPVLGFPGEPWLKAAMMNSSIQRSESNRKVSSTQGTDIWWQYLVDASTYFCELTRYDMSRKFPSGGIKDKTLSDSQRLNRMQGWKLTSSRSLGFCQENKTQPYSYSIIHIATLLRYYEKLVCSLKIECSCKNLLSWPLHKA